MVLSQPKPSARSRAAAPILARKSASFASLAIKSANWLTRPGTARNPVTPASTSERLPVASAQIQGSPDAIASKVTLPKLSVSLGKKNRSDDA